MTRMWFAAASAAMLSVGLASAAADTAQQLPRLQPTGTAPDMETVAQGGRRAEELRRTLRRIKLPAGFSIDLYAIVPGARTMAVGPSTGIVFTGTRQREVWSVRDRDSDGVADEVKAFAPALTLRIPHGLCFARDGSLYISELNRVLVFPAAESVYEKPDVDAFIVTAQGALIPPREEADNHGARICVIGPDDRLYISLGQRFNVPPAEKLDLYNEWGIGGIIRMDRDGRNRAVYARGIRNSVGMDFNPKNGELWFTDNQVDGMGDDIPPGELNRITRPGQNFGFPWYGGGKVRTHPYRDAEVPADVVFPEVEMVAHAADLGMTFYRGSMFPASYRGGIFSVQHGSWDRTEPIGARVMFTPLKEDGSAGETMVFAEGWLTLSGEYLGRPAAVAELPDGSLLVSDDAAGAIYRISFSQ